MTQQHEDSFFFFRDGPTTKQEEFRLQVKGKEKKKRKGGKKGTT